MRSGKNICTVWKDTKGEVNPTKKKRGEKGGVDMEAGMKMIRENG